MSDATRVILNRPQFEWLRMRKEKKYSLFVGGFGSGKTRVGCTAMCEHFLAHPKLAQGYFAPSYPQIRDIFYPTVEEVAYAHGMTVKINESNKEVHFSRGRWDYGTTICRSLERPQTIVGFKIANALVDELDVLPEAKAQMAWNKIIARMRYNVPGVRNGVDVTTTPEGFRFVYRRFVEAVRKNPKLGELYGLVQASTFENAINLPPDYIPSLLASYPSALINAYLNGEFTNLTQGSVYPSFDRQRNNTSEVIQPGEVLHIGMDFNVGKMAAVVHVQRDGQPLALWEFFNLLDTPAMIREIKRVFPGVKVFVYPDASGDNRHSSRASETDISLLEQAGFTVVCDSTNPAVKDRVLCMNRMLEGQYKINVSLCPYYADSLERQAYNVWGEPDKTGGYDHCNDAAGYFITYRYPIVHNRMRRIILNGT